MARTHHNNGATSKGGENERGVQCNDLSSLNSETLTVPTSTLQPAAHLSGPQQRALVAAMHREQKAFEETILSNRFCVAESIKVLSEVCRLKANEKARGNSKSGRASPTGLSEEDGIFEECPDKERAISRRLCEGLSTVEFKKIGVFLRDELPHIDEALARGEGAYVAGFDGGISDERRQELAEITRDTSRTAARILMKSPFSADLADEMYSRLTDMAEPFARLEGAPAGSEEAQLYKGLHACLQESPQELVERLAQARGHRERAALAREPLVVTNQGLVVQVAMGLIRRHPHLPRQGITVEDLIGEGNTGLLKGLTRFNPEMGTLPMTYARYWIRQAMQVAILRKDLVRISLYQARILAGELKVKPSPDAESKLADARRARQVQSLDYVARGSQRNREAGLHVADSSNPVEDVHRKLKVEAMREGIERVRAQLTERENLLFELRFIAELPMKEIGRCFRVSKARIGQLLDKLVDKVTQLAREEGLDEMV